MTEDNMKIFIMRGLPGSGKTTWLKRVVNPCKVFSADHFHVIDGVYQYDKARASFAHNQCLKMYITCLCVEKHVSSIAVDNTNTTLVELAPYVRIAESLGFDYEVITVYCPIELAYSRNTHDVPLATLCVMYNNLLNNPTPPHWKQSMFIADK